MVSWLRSKSPAIAPPSPDPDGSDAELVAQARQGDSRAFALLYRRYLGQVYDYCRHRLGTREAAEDATQTVFVKALGSIRTCRDGDLFAGWLFAIARNVVTDAYRAGRVGSVDIDDRPDIADPARSPEEAAIGAEWTRLLLRLGAECVGNNDRDLLDLRLQGLTDREIAVALGRTHGAIRIAQHRMLKRLRDCMGLNREADHVTL
jgi:RNA polymerase sigma-70 factor (ECF subfamily)